jgi:hypothetical protein
MRNAHLLPEGLGTWAAMSGTVSFQGATDRRSSRSGGSSPRCFGVMKDELTQHPRPSSSRARGLRCVFGYHAHMSAATITRLQFIVAVIAATSCHGRLRNSGEDEGTAGIPVEGSFEHLVRSRSPEPEEFLSGVERVPDPVVFRATFEHFQGRRCELMTFPSDIYAVRTPSGNHANIQQAVFLAQEADGSAEVVTVGNAPDGIVRTASAHIDARSAEIVSGACAAVLAHRSPKHCCSAKDATTYYAAHPTPNGELRRTVSSPRQGTVADWFVLFEGMMRQFVETKPQDRDALRAALVARAEWLSRWVATAK